MKITNRRDFLKFLKKNGYKLISSAKHEKWSNGENIIIVPNKHKSFHVTGHNKILKNAGLVKN